MSSAVGIFPDHKPGRFFLAIQDDGDERATTVFEERGLQGGGYTWEGILTSLLQLKMPEALTELEIGAEADNMYAYSTDRSLLDKVADLVRAAINNRDLLIAAIDNAGDDLE